MNSRGITRRRDIMKWCRRLTLATILPLLILGVNGPAEARESNSESATQAVTYYRWQNGKTGLCLHGQGHGVSAATCRQIPEQLWVKQDEQL